MLVTYRGAFLEILTYKDGMWSTKVNFLLLLHDLLGNLCWFYSWGSFHNSLGKYCSSQPLRELSLCLGHRVGVLYDTIIYLVLMLRNYLTTNCNDTHAPLSMQEYGSVLYLGCVTGIWIDFKEMTKGRWSHHQSLGFFYGVVGQLTLFDFITNPKLRKRLLFLI